MIIALALIAVLVVFLAVFLLRKRTTKPQQPSTGISKDASNALSSSKSKPKLSHNTETYSDPGQFLVSLDLGSSLSTKILNEIDGESDVRSALKQALLTILQPVQSEDGEEQNDVKAGNSKPQSAIFVGVNGVGKTTSIGKIASLLASQGHSVVLGAADTFRAAAADQLEIWAKRSGGNSVSIVRGEQNADPASVAYRAADSAVRDNADYLFIDTAGRQQTNKNLMDELGKIRRTVEKHTTIDDVLLVVDGTAGQTAREQAKSFHEVTNITGVVVTKLDGTAKGGAVFLVAEELGVPIRYIGTGEGVDDVEKFDAEKYVDSLLTSFTA